LLTAAAVLACSATARAGESVRRYGQATPGSGDVAPTLWVNGVPRPGDATFRLRVERALGGTWGLTFLSTTAADFTHGGVRFLIDPGSAVYGGAQFLSGQGAGGGRGDVPLPLPRAASLIGQPLFVQVFTLDDFAPNPLGIAATRALRLVPALPGAVLAARSLSGSPDVQSVVETEANRVVDYDGTTVADGRSATFAPGGDLALVLDAVGRRLQAYEYHTSPPALFASIDLGSEGEAALAAVLPDGTRAYVAHTGAVGTQPPIAAYDVRRGAGFGQPWPGGPVRLAGVHDTVALVFAPDGSLAYVAARGSAAGQGGSVTKVDVRAGSATFHQQLARIDFPRREVSDVALDPEGSTLYVALTAPGQPGQLATLDLGAFAPVDQDPGALGVQHLGGEISLPRTPLPDVLGKLAADPRGDDVYACTTGAVVRVTVAPSASAFRQVVATSDNIPAGELVAALAVSDAGERVYAATSRQVIELDATTLLSPRGWPLTGVVSLAFR